MKIIQISSASSSYSVKDYKEDILRAWHSQICYGIKKFDSELEVESWTIERKFNREGKKFYKDIKFRVFPTIFSFRHGVEISFSMLKKLKKEIKKAKKERRKLIIHLHEHHTWQSYLLLFFIKKNKNIKIFSQHHGGRSPFQNLKKYKKLILFLPLIILLQLIEKILFKKIDMIYGESIDEIDYLKKSFPTSNFKFQTMGINKEYFKNYDKKESRKKLNLKQNKKYLLFLGRVTTKKGMRELLSAMEKLQSQKNLKLLIIGGGNEYKFYENYVKNNQINNVKFLGTIYGEKKLLYLSACDCLILPSYTESAPVTLMEAISMNLQIIATKVGGIPLMIEDGKEGILIDSKSRAEIVIAIKKILKWKNKDIKKSAEKYKWEKIIKQTINDYKKS